MMLYNTLRQYEYIVAIARTGSLTEAAAELHVSQPSLSVAVTRVEEKLGKPIFVRRKGTALQITPFGHRLIRRAQQILDLANAIEDGLDVAQPFILGCFQDIAPWHLAPALKTLRSQFPHLPIQGREGRFAELAVDLAEGRIDMAITYNVGFGENFARRTIKEIFPVAFLSRDHPLAPQAAISLESLVEHPLILSTEELSEGYVRGLFEKRRLKPDIAARAASLESMRSLAAHGNGVGVSYTCPPTEASYDGCPLITRPISSPEAAADIVLVWSLLRETDRQFLDIVELIATL